MIFNMKFYLTKLKVIIFKIYIGSSKYITCMIKLDNFAVKNSIYLCHYRLGPFLFPQQSFCLLNCYQRTLTHMHLHTRTHIHIHKDCSRFIRLYQRNCTFCIP